MEVTTEAGLLAPSRRGWSRGRSLLRVLAIAVPAAAVLALGLWGVTASRDAEGAGHVEAGAAVGEWAEVQGGFFRVDRAGERVPTHSMIGMDPDPVPEGVRRLLVDVTLAGNSQAGLVFGPDRFAILGHSLEPVRPARAHLASGRLAAGSQISGSLLFEVPASASDLRLAFDGGTREVALPVGEAHEASAPGHP